MKKICIVGYGLHTKKTIIPSLNLDNKNIKIITNKHVESFETISDIKIALKKLPKDYIFFNSTPPKFHYTTTKLILSAGFNVIVEKPLCLNVLQLEKLHNLANKKKLFMFENMMYFYSKQFNYLKKLLNKRKINKIDIKFSIPDINKKSFRSENNLNSSLLYDMGCYPFSLVSFFGFDNKKFNVVYKTKNNKLSYLKVNFICKKIKFEIIFSIFQKYENFIQVNFKDNSTYKLNHFFYGKKIQKKIYIYKLNKKIEILKINEINLFKKIFNYSNKKLLALSQEQFFVIKNYLKRLNIIKKKIKL